MPKEFRFLLMMEREFNKIKDLARSNKLPGLSLMPGYLFLIFFIAVNLLLAGCQIKLQNRGGRSHTSLNATSNPTVEAQEVTHTPHLEIELTAESEPTPTVTATSEPFEPLAVSAPNCDYGGNFQEIEALDRLTVRFSFCEPEIAFPSKMAFPAFSIQSADWLERMESNGDIRQLLEKPVGTGPYQVHEWKKGEALTLKVFHTYWRKDHPKTKTLIFTWNKDPSERLLALQTHVVDGIDNVTHTDFALVRDDPDLMLLQRPSLNVAYIGFNNRVAPYDHPLVRQAIALGLDRQRIVDVAFPEGYQVATHFAPCDIPFACQGENWYPFDPELAKNLLLEAGYPNGFQTELFYRDVLRGYLPRPDLVAQEIRSQLWENLKINVKVRKVEQEEFTQDVDRGALDGLYLLGWGADYPDLTNFLNPHFGKEASEQFGEKNADLVRLLEEGALEIKSEDRKKIYQMAHDSILKDIPMIPVAHGGWYSHDRLAVAYRARVQNPPVDAFGFEIFSEAYYPGQDYFIWMQAEEPLSLYCPDETDSDSLRACMQISESLYTFRNQSAIAKPNLVDNCEPNKDLTVWTCNLRDGVFFHDGSTLDANDVVMSFWVQWDDSHPLHIGNYDYFKAFWGSLISTK